MPKQYPLKGCNTLTLNIATMHEAVEDYLANRVFQSYNRYKVTKIEKEQDSFIVTFEEPIEPEENK